MQENTGIPSWNMILRQRVMGSSRDDATQFLHLQRSAFLLWLVDHWKSRHYVGSKRLNIMKQRNIPEQQNLQIHRCVNRRTECQNMFLPSAAMRHCMIIEHAQCEADNAIFVQKFRKSKSLPNKTSTDDSEDTDNEMNCSRWTVSSMRYVRLHGRKKWSGSTVFWNETFAVERLPCSSIRVGADHYRTTYMDKSRTQWPWGRRVVYLLSLDPCN